MIGSSFSCARAQVGHWKSESSRISTSRPRCRGARPLAVPRRLAQRLRRIGVQGAAEADDQELLGLRREAVVRERAVRRRRG